MKLATFSKLRITSPVGLLHSAWLWSITCGGGAAGGEGRVVGVGSAKEGWARWASSAESSGH